MNAAIDITTEQRKTLLALLRRFIPGVVVWAYGSRIKWTARINSDLDLVAFAPPSQRSTVSELKEALAESDLPFLVDLHIWDDVPKRFHEIIFKEYVVVQEAKEKTEVAFAPKDWETVTLGDLGRVVTGKTPLTAIDENFGGQIPFVTPSDMDGRKTISTTARNLTEAGAASVKGSKIPAGSVMVSCIGSDMGKAVIAGRDCVSNQQINSIIVDDRFSSEFVYYNLSTRKDEIRHQAAGGSAQPILNKGHFSRLEITLPPLAEQKAIAAVLGALDDKIELNRRMNARLEEMARVLFQSWFVDFDPVRAKLDGRQPVGLDPGTAALFPEHLEDSPLGDIPKGWQVQRISEVVEEVFDGPHATPPNAVEGPVFLGIKNLTGSALDLSEIRHISESDWPRWTKRVTPRSLDIVFSYEATLGFFALIPPGLRCCLGRRLALIRPISEVGHPHFWFHQFIGPDFQRYLMQHSVQGATVDRIPLIQFPDYLVLNPPPVLKGAFESRVAPLWVKIHANANQSRTLATLRDTLLPKLLSGQYSVTPEN
jgi:type I restriction enzyme, S subunit